MGQESGHSVASSTTATKGPARTVVSSEGSTEAGSMSEFTRMIAGRIQFLKGHCPEGLLSMLAVGWSSSSQGSAQHDNLFIKIKLKESLPARQKSSPPLGNLVSKGVSHSLFIIMKL